MMTQVRLISIRIAVALVILFSSQLVNAAEKMR